MSKRQAQVASALRRAIQTVFVRGLNDPRIKGSCTVTDVRVDPDLRGATVSVSVTPEDAARATMAGLSAASKHIRHQVSGEVGFARVPDLRFRLDNSLKQQARVIELIAQGVEELRRKEGEPEDAADRASVQEEEQTEQGNQR